MLARMPSWSLALLLLLNVCTATAEGGLDLGVVVVGWDVEEGKDCPAPVRDPCLVEVDPGDAPGNASVNAYQRIGYLGVAIDDAPLREHGVHVPLLPDDGVRANGSEIYVHHPFLRTAANAVAHVPQEAVLGERHAIQLDEEAVGARYVGPHTGDPTGIKDRRVAIGWGREHGLGYDRAGPINSPGGASSDSYAAQLRRHLCFFTPGPSCESARDAAIGAAVAHGPNARIGLEFYDAQVATDPASLRAAAGAAAGADPARGVGATGGGAPAPPPEDARALPRVPTPDARAAPLRTPSGERPLPTEGAVAIASAPPASPPPLPPDSPWRVTAMAAAAGAALLLAFALHSRFATRQEVLVHKARRDLLDALTSSPGISLAEAARAIGARWHTTAYHVRMLQKQGLVRVVKEHHATFLFPTGAQGERPADLPLWVAAHPVRSAIVEAVASRPEGLTRRGLHEILANVPLRTRNHTLQRLLERGVLRQEATPAGEVVVRRAGA